MLYSSIVCLPALEVWHTARLKSTTSTTTITTTILKPYTVHSNPKVPNPAATMDGADFTKVKPNYQDPKTRPLPANLYSVHCISKGPRFHAHNGQGRLHEGRGIGYKQVGPSNLAQFGGDEKRQHALHNNALGLVLDVQ